MGFKVCSLLELWLIGSCGGNYSSLQTCFNKFLDSSNASDKSWGCLATVGWKYIHNLFVYTFIIYICVHIYCIQSIFHILCIYIYSQHIRTIYIYMYIHIRIPIDFIHQANPPCLGSRCSVVKCNAWATSCAMVGKIGKGQNGKKI